ncbi:MAG: hypothetical protein ACLU9T_00020 [Blautia faecis]
MINKIKAAGALGFVTVCGTPLDRGEDRIPTQYRRKAGDLPGASIHYLDAVEIVEKQASKCCLEHSAERDFPQFRQCGSTHSGN